MPELKLRLALLRDKRGASIARPESVMVSVSFTAKEGVAQAWDAATGKTLIAELHGARVDWINVGGIRMTGMEPIDLNAERFRLQEWHLAPAE